MYFTVVRSLGKPVLDYSHLFRSPLNLIVRDLNQVVLSILLRESFPEVLFMQTYKFLHLIP